MHLPCVQLQKLWVGQPSLLNILHNVQNSYLIEKKIGIEDQGKRTGWTRVLTSA